MIEDLETYDGGQPTKYRPPWFRRRRRSLSWPGSKSAGLLFEVNYKSYFILVLHYFICYYKLICIVMPLFILQDSGFVIMTNAFLLSTGNEG